MGKRLSMVYIKYIRVVILLLLPLIFCNSAYAYIDPGSGSMLFQIAVAFIITIVFVLKKCFSNIKMFFSKVLKLFCGDLNHDSR